MNFDCVKTGCSVYLSEYDAWAYGDAFKGAGCFIFRLCEINRLAPVNHSPRHFTVSKIAQWFDQLRTSQEINSTLIAYAADVTDHGYEGIPDPDVP